MVINRIIEDILLCALGGVLLYTIVSILYQLEILSVQLSDLESKVDDILNE